MGDRIHTSHLFSDGKFTKYNSYQKKHVSSLQKISCGRRSSPTYLPTPSSTVQAFSAPPLWSLFKGQGKVLRLNLSDFTSMNKLETRCNLNPDDQILRSLFVSYPGSGRSWMRSMFEVHKISFVILPHFLWETQTHIYAENEMRSDSCGCLLLILRLPLGSNQCVRVIRGTGGSTTCCFNHCQKHI